MSDETSNESNDNGKEDNNGVTDDKENPSPVEKVTKNYEELKEANDKVEAELLRGEELRAKIARGGKSIAGQESQETKEETPKEYRKRVDKEMKEGKTEFGN